MKILITIFTIIFINLTNIVSAKEGDVYFCETITNKIVKFDKTTEYKNERFKFIRKNNQIEFGSYDGFFDDSIISINNSSTHEEIFKTLEEDAKLFIYKDGDFMYVHNNFFGPDPKEWYTLIIHGNCDIF